ncbi:hypothetical protein ABK040_016216 [Willaertia magna]
MKNNIHIKTLIHKYITKTNLIIFSLAFFSLYLINYLFLSTSPTTSLSTTTTTSSSTSTTSLKHQQQPHHHSAKSSSFLSSIFTKKNPPKYFIKSKTPKELKETVTNYFTNENGQNFLQDPQAEYFLYNTTYQLNPELHTKPIKHNTNPILAYFKKKTKLEHPKYTKLRNQNAYIVDSNGLDLTSSSWLIENVCMNYKGKLLIYTNGDIRNSYLQHIENKPIALLQSWKRGIRGNIDFKIITGEIPYETIDRWIEQPVLLAMRYAAGNVGHLLADNLLPIYELMAKYELDPREVFILFMDEIFHRNCPPDPNPADIVVSETCPEFMSSFWYNKTNTVKWSLSWTHMLTKNPLLQKCSYKLIENEHERYQHQDDNEILSENKLYHRIETAPCPLDDIEDKQRNKDNVITKRQSNIYVYDIPIGKRPEDIQVCFKKLVLGMGDRSYVKSKQFSTFRDLPMLGLRKVLFENMGLERFQNINLKKKIIVAIHDKPKTGRHGNAFSNIDEIVNHLRNVLPRESFIRDLDKEIVIVPVKLENMSPVEQFEFFANVDVYIATVGSGSFYSLLMPEDSYLLYAPECIRTEDKKFGYDWSCYQPIIYFHTSLPHLTVFELTRLVRDCVFREGSFDGYKDACDLVIDLPGLTQEVIKALRLRLLQ